MAAHRYWRINVKSVNSGSDYPAVSKFQLLNAAGTNLATIPANASGEALGTNVVSNAIVGQAGFWTANNYAPKSWSYDLGAGNTANIVSVVVTADGTVAPGGVTGAPNSIDVMWSDDGTTYTTSWSATPACTSAQLTSTVSSGAVAAPTPTISANPTSVTAGTAGQTIAITGTGLTGASFALSGGLGSIITAQSVASATAASVTLSPGLLGFGTLTLTASTGGTASISVATPALGAVAIGFIGDSITAGVNGNPPGTVVTSLTTVGYSVTSVNRGIGGTTTQDWLPSGSILGPAITAIKAAGCTVVLMMLGTNDVRTPLSLTPAQHNANLAQIVQALVSAGLQVVLNKAMFTVPNSGSGSQVWPNDPNSFYRAAWALDCRLANGVNVFCGDTTGFEQSQASPQSYISDDGIHPSSAGNTALGQAWAAGWLQRYGPAISRWTH